MNKCFVFLILLLSSASASCVDDHSSNSLENNLHVHCPSEGRGDSARMSNLMEALKKTVSVDKGQEIAIKLGIAYEKNVCLFFRIALRSGLNSEQIARIVVTLPVETIDRPCDRMNRLHIRSQAIGKLEHDIEAISRVKGAIEEAEAREFRACRAKNGVREH